jgi:hypothetical protein
VTTTPVTTTTVPGPCGHVPPADLPPDPRSFLTFAFRDLPPASDAGDYYDVVDHDGLRKTLEEWKILNGFGDPQAMAIYLNANDLGFGRRMSMRRDDQRIAFYVENYCSVDAALDPLKQGLLATVAMELSPPDKDPNGAPFIKFFTYKANGDRIDNIDLDGRGVKFQPEVCTPCHGGRATGTYEQSGGNIGARFIPFDLDAFNYSLQPGLSRAEQESQFKELNRTVLDADQQLYKPSAAIQELIEGWYGGPGLPGTTFDSSFVPDGWVQDPSLYDAVRHGCRGCHAQTALPLNSLAQFRLLSNGIRQLVCEEGQMPLARRTFERFWTSTSTAPVTIGDALPGDFAWQSLGTSGKGMVVSMAAAAPGDPAHLIAAGRVGGELQARQLTVGASSASWGGKMTRFPTSGDPLALTYDPLDPSVNYALVTPDRVLKSSNNNWSTTQFEATLPAQRFVVQLATGTSADGLPPSEVYVVLRENSDPTSRHDLYRLAGTWTLCAQDVRAVAPASLTPGQLPVLFGIVGGIPQESTDCAHWTPLTGHPAALLDSIIVDPFDENVLIVQGLSNDPDEGRAAWRTDDRGQTWSLLTPLTPLAFDPYTRGVLYGGASSSTADPVRSLDGGRTWGVLDRSRSYAGILASSDRADAYLFEPSTTETTLSRGTLLGCGPELRPGRVIARVRAPREVNVGSSALLNGAFSLNLPQGSQYAATIVSQPAGVSPMLLGDATAMPQLIPATPGFYTVELSVRGPSLGTDGTDRTLVSVLARQTGAVTSAFRDDVSPKLDPCRGCHTGPTPPNGFDLGDSSKPEQAYLPARLRVTPTRPDTSLLLLKPSGRVSHGGGIVAGFEVGDQNFRVVEDWISRGAPLD